MLMSGVASFSLYRSSAAHQPIGAASPSSATIWRASGETGCERVVVELGAGEVRQPRVEEADEVRAIRLFACPRSPSRMTSWPARIAFSSCGRTRLVVAEDARQERAALADGAPAGWRASPP